MSKELELRVSDINKNITTRKQKEFENWLDFLFLSNEITSTIKLENFKSDHFRLLFELKSSLSTKIKNWWIRKSQNLTEENRKDIILHVSWPNRPNKFRNKTLLWKSTHIRPTIKIKAEIKKIFESEQNLEEKTITLKTLRNEGFKEYIKNFDTFIFTDSRKFYKIIKSLVKSKPWRFVKGIKQADTILLDEEKNLIIKDYFEKLYKNYGISNCIIYKNQIEYNEELQLNIDYSLEKIAKHKACGTDEIPGEFFYSNKWIIF